MMKKSLLIMLIFLVVIQGVLALSAGSENYSIGRFGTGLQATNLNSTNLTGQAILLTNNGLPSMETDELNVSDSFWDNSLNNSLSINSYSISPQSTSIGSIVGIYISASNFQDVWAKIVFPNNQEQIISLINNQSIYYLPNPAILGTYTIIFYANSSYGAIASMIDHFDLTAPASPSASSGGGSSGGGGSAFMIEKNCNYDWDCTQWSSCSGGKQVRNCTNIGTCAGTSSKPSEEVSCSDALFDVSLKLKDIGLIQNSTLLFDMTLIDKMNAEKIDVYIKYSIIDGNNTEIFRQIETRAIQGNLTYEKEINDMNLSAGEYFLKVDVLYGNLQRAFTEYKFTVNNKGVLTRVEEQSKFGIQALIEPVANNDILFDALVLLVLICLITLLFKKKALSNESAKHSEETQVNSESSHIIEPKIEPKKATPETMQEVKIESPHIIEPKKATPKTIQEVKIESAHIEPKIVAPPETMQEVKIKSALIENLGKGLMRNDIESETVEVKPESFHTDVSGRVLGVSMPQHPDMYVREIHELLDKCEKALNSGMIEDAQEWYNDARTIYFGSGLNYDQKTVVYMKMMELHGKLSKLQQ